MHVAAEEGAAIRGPDEAAAAGVFSEALHIPPSHELSLEGHAGVQVEVVAVDRDLYLVAAPVEGDGVVVTLRHAGHGLAPAFHLPFPFHGVNDPGVHAPIRSDREDPHRPREAKLPVIKPWGDRGPLGGAWADTQRKGEGGEQELLVARQFHRVFMGDKH